MNREMLVTKFKYAPLLLILILHQVFRYLDAQSLNKSFESAVNGNGGINDAFWYLGIAEHGYNFAPIGEYAHQSAWVFYPLWPNLLAVGHHLGIPVVWWGLVLVTLVAFLAAVQLSRLVALQFNTRVGYISAVLFVGQLYALSLVSLMTESLFALISFTTLIAWKQRQFNRVGVLVSLACLTKSFGVALALTIFISILIKLKKSEITFRSALFPLLTCIFSPLIWMSIVSFHFKNISAYFEIQRDGWGNKFDPGFSFLRFMYDSVVTFRQATSWETIVALIVCITVVLIGWSLWFPVPVEWKIFIITSAYLSIAHQSWHIADARFLTSIGLCVFPAAVALDRSKPSVRNILIAIWLLPSFYLSSFATSGF